MENCTFRPASDLAPNDWTREPAGGDHFSVVDDWPYDDQTHLYTLEKDTPNLTGERFSMTAAPENLLELTQITPVVRIKYALGFGVDYYGITVRVYWGTTFIASRTINLPLQITEPTDFPFGAIACSLDKAKSDQLRMYKYAIGNPWTYGAAFISASEWKLDGAYVPVPEVVRPVDVETRLIDSVTLETPLSRLVEIGAPLGPIVVNTPSARIIEIDCPMRREFEEARSE